jgi:hypothetical protein
MFLIDLIYLDSASGLTNWLVYSGNNVHISPRFQDYVYAEEGPGVEVEVTNDTTVPCKV